MQSDWKTLAGAFPIDHFHGLETNEDLPRDERRLRDLWF